MVRVRWEMCLGGNLSFSQGEDVHLLSVKDLRLIHPSLDSSGDRGHGEDHISNLLIQSERELANEGELLLHPGLHREILEVGDDCWKLSLMLPFFSLKDFCLSESNSL